MVQESTMICIDNSEWMRNGDLSPTRLQCQQDAVNLVMQCKLRSNPENAVGLLSMADTVRVLSTMTSEDRKLFAKLHDVDVEGTAKILSAIKVAHLALKHRQNRNHRMRIIVFLGSPIENVDNQEFIKLAKKLKKEKVSVDVVCFGEATAEENKVVADFIDIVNGKDGTSNLLCVSAGSKLTEALLNSAICRGEDGAPVGGAGGFEFDAEDDPELALALRVSLEEQRQRQRTEQERNPAAADGAGGGSDAAAREQGDGAPSSGGAAMDVDRAHGGADAAAALGPSGEDVDLAAMTEEEQIQWALRMSMQQDAAAEAQARPADSTGETPMETDDTKELGELENNPELLRQLVDNLGQGGSTTEQGKNNEDPAKKPS
ncbi:hypothetical protein AAVH_04876 [Aphelenchoides avenae]|nr:hypothetical protein AAVH_04876 [Aphelenchus avenae]